MSTAFLVKAIAASGMRKHICRLRQALLGSQRLGSLKAAARSTSRKAGSRGAGRSRSPRRENLAAAYIKQSL
jgi:hypothetical protein